MKKGIIVAVKLDKVSIIDFEYELEELKNLANSCDIEIVDTVTQNLEAFNSHSYIGKGKIDEVKMVLDAQEAEVVVINDELSPLQINTLDEQLEVAIYDRTFLILEIFKSRAKTKEAIIQVELAELSYTLPRLTGLRQGLSRQRGTGGGFAHGRGAGETKLELDRRITYNEIAELKKELKELTLKRKQQRAKRNKSHLKTICLVGYTNSGKSTLLNRLINTYSNNENKKVLSKDMLFATLETSTRLIESNYGSFLLTDTVGFIDKLPTHLIEAFKSTLEEILDADLIVHVVDTSNPRFNEQVTITNNVLQSIGVNIGSIPIIYAFNKIDKVTSYFYIGSNYINDLSKAIRISALDGTNIDELVKLIIDSAYSEYYYQEFFIPYDKQENAYKIKEEAIYFNMRMADDGIHIGAKVSIKIINQYSEFKAK